MSIISILEGAEGGRFFANAAKACGIDEAQARTASEKFAPTIALRLKDKASKDPEAFEQLFDLIEEGDASELNEDGALTDADAQQDGAAIIADLYGTGAEANAVFKGLAGPIDKAAASTLAAINATAVLAALSATNAVQPAAGNAPAAEAGSGGGQGFFAVLFAALLKGLLQGASRQLAPKRRRRRYSSYYGRKPVRRSRKRSVGLEDVFKEILSNRR
jgi:Bacterial protein of unknown function (DUF937)